MLHIVLWKWIQDGFKESYSSEYVNIVGSMIRRNINGVHHRIVCVTDDPGGIDMSIDVHPLWKDYDKVSNASGSHLPSCYRRLKIFDTATQKSMGIHPGDRIMSLDLDTVITGDLVKIVTRQGLFVGWAVRGTRHYRVFNGSLFMFDAGTLEYLWTKFNPIESPKKSVEDGYFGSDQGWLSYNLSKNNDCIGFTYPVVSSYPREISRRPKLPPQTVIVNFHGRRKPWHENVQREATWITEHWRV